MRRVLPALLLMLSLAPVTWLREPPAPEDASQYVRFDPVALPAKAEIARRLGPFELERVWHLVSRNGAFTGFSALVALPDGRLLAVSDRGFWFAFAPPGAPPAPLVGGTVLDPREKRDRDMESATRDPATGTIWIGREDSNRISRHDPAFGPTLGNARSVVPPLMRDWPYNAGAEAMTRLADGRFIALEEGSTWPFQRGPVRAVLFPRDPLLGGAATSFAFAQTTGFNPTDMAQLPDGRVLILERRLVWPLPLRFTGRIVIADPADIRPGQAWRGLEVAKLEPPLPVDNMEGLAIAPRTDGRVTVWLISDDNNAATQRIVLWKMSVDPARLPRTSRKARSRSTAP